MGVEERPAIAPFGKKGERGVDYKEDVKSDADPRVGSTNLLTPDSGHFVVVQLAGHKHNPYIEEIVGVFHSLTRADQYANKDRGLKVYSTEVLG